MKDLVKAAMVADSTINTALTGGIHTAREVSRYSTPAAFDDNREVKPCALVKETSDYPDGPNDIGTTVVMTIYLYERDSYSTIDIVHERLKEIFDRVKLGTAASRVYEIRWIGSVPMVEDEALQCNMHMVRFRITRLR